MIWNCNGTDLVLYSNSLKQPFPPAPLHGLETLDDQARRKRENMIISLANTVFNKQQLTAALKTFSETMQIALAGRSNVGKSSLVNALGERRQLAKTSATPGKTRSINFYRVEKEHFLLVDLPGYGYAKCSQEEQDAWAKLIECYLNSCSVLRAVALLLDCRLTPQASDCHLAEFVQNLGIPLLPILTKIDKCSSKEQNRSRQEWQNLGFKPILVSAKEKTGIEYLRQTLRARIAQ